MNPIIHYILYTHWISWLMHFIGFFIFMRFSGVKLTWAILLVFGVEIWEMFDWSIKNPLRWWQMTDTYLDIFAGLSGVFLAWIFLRKLIRKNKVQSIKKTE